MGHPACNASKLGEGKAQTDTRGKASRENPAIPHGKERTKKAPHFTKIKWGRNHAGKATLEFIGLGAKLFIAFIDNAAAIAECSRDVALSVWVALKIAKFPTVAELQEMEAGK